MFPRPRWCSHQAGLWGISAQLTIWAARNIRRFDVVHVHYVWTLSTVVGVFLGAVTRRPVVLTAHESLTRYDIDTASGSGLKRRLKLGLRRILIRHVDVVVCASPLERQDSLDPGESGVVIYHPVVEAPLAVARPEPPEPPFVIGYLGRLHPKKNVEIALRAVARLPTTRLVLCGDGDPTYREHLHALADRLGVSDRIVWRGHVDATGRDALFSECHVTVMPSAYECFGMAAAEAMAAGVPVIVSKTTGLAEVVSEFSAGGVVETGDADDLASCLRTMMASSRSPLRSNAAAAAENRLSFDAYGEAIAATYRSALVSDLSPDPGPATPPRPDYSLEEAPS